MERLTTLLETSWLALALIGAGCSAATHGGRPDGAYARAVEHAENSNAAAALAALRVALETDSQTCQRALLEPAFRTRLRDTPAFRSAMHDAARRHRISHLQLVSTDEPGERMHFRGTVVDPQGTPVAGAVVRVFATDTSGRYHPTIEGERVPRIFGTLVSDEAGRFSFETVRPGPYPGTREARHIHVTAGTKELRMARPGYAVFADDPLLDEPQNAEQAGEAIRIAVNAEDDATRATFTLPLRRR